MELIERDIFLDALQIAFRKIDDGEGHCILIRGEAGIGKTSLVRAFCSTVREKCKIYQGSCDALFAPQPLAPLYDILLQLRKEFPQTGHDIEDRTAFFSQIFYEFKKEKEVNLIVFEDIHWADEATLDFIKFLARRITQLKCLLILTYRDTEIHLHHPLGNVLGHLNPDTFTRIELPPLSRNVVEKLAEEKGYKGEDVYAISEGNPFYVNEILASYSTGVPDNIRDSVLSSYNRLDEDTKHFWQILSVLPTGFEMKYLEKMESSYARSIQSSLDLKILIISAGTLHFKHELFRRTIENSLSPFLRIELHKRILELFRESFEKSGQIERIIHHAKNANDDDTVVHFAPVAARHAARVGAHMEASRLYLTAIQYYQGADQVQLLQFYKQYAFECYLTNQIKESIIYATKALTLLKEKKDVVEVSGTLRFLSRLWWVDGNRAKAEAFAHEAIGYIREQPSSRTKAMVFSNLSQLKMLSEQPDECLIWGEQAITIAREIQDEETLSHALINVGTIRMRVPSTRQLGKELLQQSLTMSLENNYEEYAVRAYINLVSNSVRMRDYSSAKLILKDALIYCEERDIDFGSEYLTMCKARLQLETGEWNEAFSLCEKLIRNEDQPSVIKIGVLIVMATLKMRRGDPDVLPLLVEAKEKAFKTSELQRMVPVMIAMLEYEWISASLVIEKNELDLVINMAKQASYFYENGEFAFWLNKARGISLALPEAFLKYPFINREEVEKAAEQWKQLGCPYEEALALFEGNEEDKRKAISIIDKLGATTVFEKMKFMMRSSGIKQVPRGIRKTTRTNAANLTQREIDILQLLKEGLHNKEIGERLFISVKTVDHHISSILFKLDVPSRTKAVQEALNLAILL